MLNQPNMYGFPRVTPALKALLIANGVVFFLQSVALYWFQSQVFLNLFALSGANVSKGFVWTLVSYSFLHANVWHLLLNMLLLYFMGSIVEEVEGSKRFLYVYFLGTTIGGLLWLLFHSAMPHQLMGASAASLGLLIYFCLYQPDRPITLLLFFVIPVTLKPRWVMWAVIALDLFGFLFQEMGQGSSFANSAHLGGMLAGFICYRVFQGDSTVSFGGIGAGASANWIKRKTSKVFSKTTFRINMGAKAKEDLSQEVDRILDKINDHGFGALSEEEKRILDQARDNLKK